jgi:hypothetical protein
MVAFSIRTVTRTALVLIGVIVVVVAIHGFVFYYAAVRYAAGVPAALATIVIAAVLLKHLRAVRSVCASLHRRLTRWRLG